MELTTQATTQAHYKGWELEFYKFAKSYPKRRIFLCHNNIHGYKRCIPNQSLPLDGVFPRTNIINPEDQERGLASVATYHVQSFALMVVMKGNHIYSAQRHVFVAIHILLESSNIIDISFSKAI